SREAGWLGDVVALARGEQPAQGTMSPAESYPTQSSGRRLSNLMSASYRRAGSTVNRQAHLSAAALSGHSIQIIASFTSRMGRPGVSMRRTLGILIPMRR